MALQIQPKCYTVIFAMFLIVEVATVLLTKHHIVPLTLSYCGHCCIYPGTKAEGLQAWI